MHSVPNLYSNFSDLISSYSGVLCDVWGVLHDGVHAYDGCIETLKKIKSSGIPVVLLTNAPRPEDSVRSQLRSFGIDDDCYDGIVSSGGVMLEILNKKKNQKFFHLGPARDRVLFIERDADAVSFDDADFILCTGLFDDETEKAEDYIPLLKAARLRNMSLCCANPDLVVERRSKLIPCAGAVAEEYQKLKGEVLWIGKPHALIYNHACELLNSFITPEKQNGKIICIGDALRTDILGASNANMDSVMVLSGIHAKDISLKGEEFNKNALVKLFSEYGVKPTYIVNKLIW